MAEPEKKQNKRQVFRFSGADIAARLFCLLIAFCLWIYVMYTESPDYEQVFTDLAVKIDSEDILAEEKLAVQSGRDSTVNVTISGRMSIVSNLTSEDLTASVDLNGITEGGRVSRKVEVIAPSGCKVVSVSPETVTVYVDERVDLNVELKEKYINPNGYKNGAVELPEMITVSGPKKEVTTVKSAWLTFDLTDMDRTGEVVGTVTLRDSWGEEITSNYIDYQPKKVSATIPISESVNAPVEWYFKNGFLNTENATVDINPQTVTVSGEPYLIESGDLFEPIVIDERAEFSGGLKDESGRLVMYKIYELTAKDGLTLSEDQIQMSVTVDPSISYIRLWVPSTNIKDTGAMKGIDYTWDKETEEVAFIGPVEALSALSPLDVTLTFDMGGYTTADIGTTYVRAKVEVDSPLKNQILDVGSHSIKVTFTNGEDGTDSTGDG